jgi:transcriptional regulator with XRE-family HTH domain
MEPKSVSEIVTRNIKALRVTRNMRQRQVASRMKTLGHNWSAQTVSDVERQARGLTVEELVALAAALVVTVPDIIDPAGVYAQEEQALRLWPRSIPAQVASDWIRGKVAIGLLAMDEEETTEEEIGDFTTVGLQVIRMAGEDAAFERARKWIGTPIEREDEE